jgi:hypothetical protein
VLLQKVIGHPFGQVACGFCELYATPILSAIYRWENLVQKKKQNGGEFKTCFLRRALFLKKRRKAFELRTQGATETFLNVSGASFPGEKQYSTTISIWNGQGITNRVKVFLFKFFNNILGINTRLSHFVPNQTRGCTFCSINGTNPVPDETFAHIFFDCPTVRNWHDRFLSEYTQIGYLRNEQERKNFFFLGRVLEPDGDNYFITMTILTFQSVLWEQK